MNAICGTDLRPYGAQTFDRTGFPRLKPWEQEALTLFRAP